MPHRSVNPHPDSLIKQLLLAIRHVLSKCSIGILLILTLGSILLATLDHPIALIARNYTTELVSPVLSVTSLPSHYAHHLKHSFKEWWYLKDENEALRQENRQLKQFYTQARLWQSEIKRLHALLHVVQELPTSYITARVVGDVSGPFLRNIIVNAGTLQGVKKGQLVMNEEGVLGRVYEVNQRSSRIMLITDINSRVPVMTGETKERGIMTGNNTHHMILRYLPEDTKVKPGEMVITSGDGELFPAGLAIGTIQEVSDQIVVVPLVNWSRLDYISIVNY